MIIKKLGLALALVTSSLIEVKVHAGNAGWNRNLFAAAAGTFVGRAAFTFPFAQGEARKLPFDNPSYDGNFGIPAYLNRARFRYDLFYRTPVIDVIEERREPGTLFQRERCMRNIRPITEADRKSTAAAGLNWPESVWLSEAPLSRQAKLLAQGMLNEHDDKYSKSDRRLAQRTLAGGKKDYLVERRYVSDCSTRHYRERLCYLIEHDHIGAVRFASPQEVTEEQAGNSNIIIDGVSDRAILHDFSKYEDWRNRSYGHDNSYYQDMLKKFDQEGGNKRIILSDRPKNK